MATKKRRRSRKKASPFRRYVPLLMACGIFAGLAALSYATWQAWPTLTQRWNAAKAEVLKTRQGKTVKKITPKSRTATTELRKPARVDAATVKRIEAEIQSLREENAQLRNQLQRTSEAIARKNADIDEMKLRILILQKTRNTGGGGN